MQAIDSFYSNEKYSIIQFAAWGNGSQELFVFNNVDSLTTSWKGEGLFGVAVNKDGLPLAISVKDTDLIYLNSTVLEEFIEYQPVCCEVFDFYDTKYYVPVLDLEKKQLIAEIDIRIGRTVMIPISKAFHKIKYNPRTHMLYSIGNYYKGFQLETINFKTHEVKTVAFMRNVDYKECGWNREYTKLICSYYDVKHPTFNDRVMVYDTVTNGVQYFSLSWSIEGIF